MLSTQVINTIKDTLCVTIFVIFFTSSDPYKTLHFLFVSWPTFVSGYFDHLTLHIRNPRNYQ